MFKLFNLTNSYSFISGKRVKELAVGLVHVLALTENCEVYSWGKKEYQLCCEPVLGHIDQSNDEPSIVTPLRGKNIVGIACGPTQVCFLSLLVL